MKVELLHIFGDDNMVCDTARVSFNKVAAMYSGEANDRLIQYLAKHNHWSPFSHPKIQYRICMPIYVERQLVKTQIGVEYNSISGRYVDFSDTYTTIETWRKQSKSSKQGSEGFVSDQADCSQIEKDVIEYCKKAYNELIKKGVSKEQARSILPMNLNTTMIWTGSLYAFIRLAKQRLSKDAQKETGAVVQEMLNQLKQTRSFDLSLQAYDLYNIDIVDESNESSLDYDNESQRLQDLDYEINSVS